jgi:uncharacterized protein YuzE
LDKELVKTYYVPALDTLDVWFGEIDAVVENQEVGDGVISKLGNDGEVIGVEIIGFTKTTKQDLARLPSHALNALLEAIRKQIAAGAALA